jgi:hypothetical protein
LAIALGALVGVARAQQPTDTTRRVAPPTAPQTTTDTSRSQQRVARSPLDDSARAESTAVAAERRLSLRVGNIGAIVALTAFGLAAIVFTVFLVLTLSRGNSIEMETRWGGIGGGGGGWRLSSSFSYLLAALLFGGLFASTVWALLRVGDPPPQRAAASPAPKDTTAKR